MHISNNTDHYITIFYRNVCDYLQLKSRYAHYKFIMAPEIVDYFKDVFIKTYKLANHPICA